MLTLVSQMRGSFLIFFSLLYHTYKERKHNNIGWIAPPNRQKKNIKTVIYIYIHKLKNMTL